MRYILALLITGFVALSWSVVAQVGPSVSTEEDVEIAIREFRSESPNFELFEPILKYQVKPQAIAIRGVLTRLGNVVEIDFQETDMGRDVYLVQFEYGKTIWLVAKSPQGRYSILLFNFL